MTTPTRAAAEPGPDIAAAEAVLNEKVVVACQHYSGLKRDQVVAVLSCPALHRAVTACHAERIEALICLHEAAVAAVAQARSEEQHRWRSKIEDALAYLDRGQPNHAAQVLAEKFI